MFHCDADQYPGELDFANRLAHLQVHLSRHNTTDGVQSVVKTMVLNSTHPELQCIRAATVEVMKTDSCKLWGEFKKAVAQRLGVPVEALKPWKADMQMVIAGSNEPNGNTEGDGNDYKQSKTGDLTVEEGESEPDKNEAESESGAESAQDSSSNDDSGRGNDRKSAASGTRVARTNVEGESEAMKAFKLMARAMCLGPAPFRGLKQMSKEDAEATLRNRLIDAGAVFAHAFPSIREIAKAKRQSSTAKDLEGIDTSNIVQGSRRRAQPEPLVPPETKRRKIHTATNSAATGSRSDSDSVSDGSNDSEVDSAERASEDEESEAEFELSGS